MCGLGSSHHSISESSKTGLRYLSLQLKPNHLKSCWAC